MAGAYDKYRRLRPERSFREKLADFWTWYTATFSFYMLEPWETALVHVLGLAMLLTSAYTTYWYGIPWFCQMTGIACAWVPGTEQLALTDAE